MSQQHWGAPPPPQPGGTWSRGPAPWQGGSAGWPTNAYGPPPGQFSARAAQPGYGQPPYPPQPYPGYAPGGPWQPPRPPQRKRGGFTSAIQVALVVIGLIIAFNVLRALVGGIVGMGPAPAPSNPNDPTVTYQNESYVPPPVAKNPPAVPGPRDLDAAQKLTTANPLYQESVPVPTNCQMRNSVPVSQMSANQKEAHFNELMGCLMTVWINPVEDAGFQLPRPRVYVYTSPIKTACGNFDDVNAAYCAGDQRIYYANTLMDSFPASVSSANYSAEVVLAHEFGHAIQARTAILISEKYLEQDANGKAAKQALSRRTEVQADCFAGEFVQSVAHSQRLTPSDLDGLGELMYHMGDDVLTGKPDYVGGHGTGKARQTWFTRGVRDAQLQTCNSFVAPADQVR